MAVFEMDRLRKTARCIMFALLFQPSLAYAKDADGNLGEIAQTQHRSVQNFDPGKTVEMLDQAAQPMPRWEEYEQQDIPDKVKNDIRLGRYPSLSVSEINAFRDQVSSCWAPPVGATNAAELAATFKLRLFPDGSFAGAAPVRDGNSAAARAQQTAFNAALRAVRRCAPYRLPVEKYATWREIEMNFDPSQMLDR